MWGGGWLAKLGMNFHLGHGHVDFAGSSVVHLTGGVAALVGAKLLGARIGKYDRFGKAQPIPGHNIPMALLGTFILAFGWFGFNAGSTLAGTDTRIAIVAVNTMLASAAGAFSAALFVWIRYGKPDPTWLANGMLAGLVAITAPCAFVGAPESVLIGAIAGVLVIVSANFRGKYAQNRRPRGRFERPRGVRDLGCTQRGPVRQWQLRRWPQRRRRQSDRCSSSVILRSSGRSASASPRTSCTSER